MVADSTFNWTGVFSALDGPMDNITVYAVYFLTPSIWIFIATVEYISMLLLITPAAKSFTLLTLSIVSFASGQVFEFVVSVHICQGTSGKVDGSMFQTLCNIFSVVLLVMFWITVIEDTDYVRKYKDNGRFTPIWGSCFSAASNTAHSYNSNMMTDAIQASS